MRWKARFLTPSALAAAPPGSQADWPQWRGPERTARADFQTPEQWPDRLTRVWSVEVGAALSSPVIVTYPALAGSSLVVKDERKLTHWRLD